MARGNQNINDQLFRTRGRNAAETRESQTAKVALEEGIPLLAQLPIDPALAKECDTGVIELFNEDWMEPVISAVENCPKRIQN